MSDYVAIITAVVTGVGGVTAAAVHAHYAAKKWGRILETQRRASGSGVALPITRDEPTVATAGSILLLIGLAVAMMGLIIRSATFSAASAERGRNAVSPPAEDETAALIRAYEATAEQSPAARSATITSPSKEVYVFLGRCGQEGWVAPLFSDLPPCSHGVVQDPSPDGTQIAARDWTWMHATKPTLDTAHPQLGKQIDQLPPNQSVKLMEVYPMAPRLQRFYWGKIVVPSSP